MASCPRWQRHQFDAFITADQNLGYQQNLNNLPIAVVVLAAHRNTLFAVLPLLPALARVLTLLVPQSYVVVLQDSST